MTRDPRIELLRRGNCVAGLPHSDAPIPGDSPGAPVRGRSETPVLSGFAWIVTS